jgi:rhamnogalacturonan endolyase
MKCMLKMIMITLPVLISSCKSVHYVSDKFSDDNAGVLPKREHVLPDDFSHWQKNWVVESEKGYSIKYSDIDSSLDIIAFKGLTLWYRYPLNGNASISFQACVVDHGDSLDRVSDLNCFWMATDPEFPDDIFARKDFRQGIFGKYYSLKMYYMGYGGNSNTTSRFRKYDGDYQGFVSGNKRPDIIKEYVDKQHLLKPDHWYTINISVNEGHVKYTIDGEELVDYLDSEPLTRGWFAFRTTENHMKIRDFFIVAHE